MSEQQQNDTQRSLLIRQQNTNKSLLSQLDLLESLKRDDYDICAIQEPYIDFNGKTRANRQWITIYPSTHQDHPDSTRSIILINTNLLTDAWEQIPFQHPDITALEIHGQFGTLRLINVYNDCNNNNALTHISNFMRDRRRHLQSPAPINTIWLGDFNRHHPLWDEARNAHLFTRRNLELTQPLLNMLGRHNMKMALPPFIPTLRAHNSGNYTRVDNVFCTEPIMDAIIKCHTDDATRPVKTDHFPIIIQIDIHAPKSTWKSRPNFRLADWPELTKTLTENLANIPEPTEIEDIHTFDQRLEFLNKAIQDAIKKHVPLTTPSPYSKRWWSTALANEKRLMQQLGGRAKHHRWNMNHPIHEEYRRQRNRYSDHIQKAKAEHWVEWLEGLDQVSIWQASRLVTSPATDAGKAKIPTLKIKDPITKRVIREATDNASKGRLFHETFFPPPNPATPPIPQNYPYPTPRWAFTNITNDQILHAINKLKPYKASKSNSVPNSIFTHAREALVPHLGPLFRSTHSLRYYPQEWATTETLILKKPGKPDYTTPSAWRPIVLSDGIARLLNSCQTKIMVTMCETLNILPPDHYGARPGRTTTDSIHMLTKIVKDSWRKGQVASSLFLDVKGAFPSVDINRLIHNMRKRGIPQEYTTWLKRRLDNRKTTLIFDDHETNTFAVDNGLDQGDPFSGICYLIYNSDLSEIPVKKAGERILLFVDDAAITVTGKDFSETHNKLRNIMNRPQGIFEWAKSHNCTFGIDKFQLLDLARKLVPHQLNPKKRVPIPRRTLILGAQRIPSKDTAKFLGVLVDNKLNWKSQCAAALAKGQDWLIQFGRLARTSQGINAKYIRQLYLAIAIPRMLYAADIFLTPQQNIGKQKKHNRNSRAITNKLASIQRQASIMITGAMKTTASDILEVMANLAPFHLLVDKIRYRAAIRLATLPPSHPLHKPVQNAASRLVKRHPTPLHDLMHRYKIRPLYIETVKAIRYSTSWRPNVSTKITDNPDDAIRDLELDNSDLKIFTDGSGMEGNIGAAAILYRNGRMKSSIRFKLGSIQHHTVYEGEGVGAILGAKLVSKEWGARSATFYIDNRATIMATQLTKPAPGHHIFDTLHDYIGSLKNKNRNLQITFRWIPGHKGVEGNEKADEQAKQSITEGSSDERELPDQLRTPLPRSKSALICANNEKLKNKAQILWQESPRYARLHKTDPVAPSNDYLKLVASLPRRLASTLTQLRTGHAPLAKFLHRINRMDSPTCPGCQQGTETVQHIFLHCPAYQTARQNLRNDTGGGNIDLTKLFTTPKTLRALFKFVAETGRFHKRADSVHPPEGEERRAGTAR
jgi:ribonuclease HI